MGNYKSPDVYIKDVVSGSKSIVQASSTIGVLLGVTRSGVTGVAQKISSWTEFIAKYANGLDTPFLENSYLPYSVHGFFTNGGRELYIGSIKKNAEKATATSETNKITATALTEGVWGNSVKVSIKKNADYAEDYKAFDVTVSVGNSDSATVTDLTKEEMSYGVVSNNKIKNWLESFDIDKETTELAEEEFTLAGGTDGDELTDTDYADALSMIDILDDATMVAIPGQTSKAVNDAILAYCDNNGLFPIIDMPLGSTAEETKMYRKSISAFTGALPHPWGKMADPLTNTLKLVPTAGHVMGVYARTMETYGIHKAPAGVNAVVRGFVEMEYQVSQAQINSLNPIGVICITARPNCGIVVWGARSLNSTDDKMRYVSDGLLNLNIKKSLYNGTQFAVFEANTEQLWTKLQATCKSFLETLRTSGALKGSAEEAYYVTVDSSINTQDTIDAGELNIEIGYAPVKPAEFIIIKLAHSIETAE